MNTKKALAKLIVTALIAAILIASLSAFTASAPETGRADIGYGYWCRYIAYDSGVVYMDCLDTSDL